MATSSIIYATVSFISSALVLSILPWFIRFRSVPGLCTIAWLFVVNFLYGLNAAAFTGDALLRIPVYCDITTKLLLGMQILVPTAMLCYTISILGWLVSPKEHAVIRKYFEYRSHFHAALCFLAPIVYMALHIIVQDHRFDIVESVGCIPSSSSTALSWVLIWQTLIVPTCTWIVYGIRACVFFLRQLRSYYARYKTNWEIMDSELLFTDAPYGSVRIARLGIMVQVVMTFTLVTAFVALADVLRDDNFTFSRKPDLSRIDVFTSFGDAPPVVKTIRPLLWSGPVYSVLLFAASIDKSVLESYPFVFKKYILRRPVGANPDPSPGIDLSTITPIPGRRRIHRHVVRQSQEYDPPLSALDFDIPLPPRPDPGYRITEPLPPVPSYSELPSSLEPRRPDPAHVRDRSEYEEASGLSREAFIKQAEASGNLPMHSIVESRASRTSDLHAAEGGHGLWMAATRETADNKA